MAYHDLYIKWRSDKKEQSRQNRVQEIVNESEYSVLGLNYSMHQKPYPIFGEGDCKARLTVKSDFNHILNDTEALSKYDLVAARPSTDSDFHYCCINGDLDIISLKLHDRLQFKLKLNLVQDAIKKGIMFEICYSHSLKDMNARRVFIANAATLIKAAKGKNIILSSGAKDLFEQRAPWDVINLACVLGLNVDAAHKTLVANPEAALEHAMCRKVFKSVVQVTDKQEFINTYGINYLPQ
jgi:ribonuclease P/MRP protein subunit RPP1